MNNGPKSVRGTTLFLHAVTSVIKYQRNISTMGNYLETPLDTSTRQAFLDSSSKKFWQVPDFPIKLLKVIFVFLVSFATLNEGKMGHTLNRRMTEDVKQAKGQKRHPLVIFIASNAMWFKKKKKKLNLWPSVVA